MPERDCVARDTSLPQSFDLGNATVESLNEIAQRGHNARAIGRVEGVVQRAPVLVRCKNGSRLT